MPSWQLWLGLSRSQCLPALHYSGTASQLIGAVPPTAACHKVRSNGIEPILGQPAVAPADCHQGDTACWSTSARGAGGRISDRHEMQGQGASGNHTRARLALGACLTGISYISSPHCKRLASPRHLTSGRRRTSISTLPLLVERRAGSPIQLRRLPRLADGPISRTQSTRVDSISVTRPPVRRS